MIRHLTILCLLTLSLAGFSAAAESGGRCFLVDSRWHVVLVSHETDPGGELCWHDTVTGESGEALLVREGTRMVLAGRTGAGGEVHVLPDLAIVLRNPPWGRSHPGLALGVALD